VLGDKPQVGDQKVEQVGGAQPEDQAEHTHQEQRDQPMEGECLFDDCEHRRPLGCGWTITFGVAPVA